MTTLEAMRDAPPSPWAEAFVRYTLGVVHARIARREVRIGLPALIGHLGFTVRHALPAKRHARAYLERIADIPADGIRACSGAAALELARLHVHLREPDEASRRAVQAVAIFEHQGAEEALWQARALMTPLRS
jgi:hypothetical protein